MIKDLRAEKEDLTSRHNQLASEEQKKQELIKEKKEEIQALQNKSEYLHTHHFVTSVNFVCIVEATEKEQHSFKTAMKEAIVEKEIIIKNLKAEKEDLASKYDQLASEEQKKQELIKEKEEEIQALQNKSE